MAERPQNRWRLALIPLALAAIAFALFLAHHRAPPRKPYPRPKPPAATALPVPADHVRVAAIQFCSAFGQPEENRRRLAILVRRAAAQGARIVVMPEACIPGYADMAREIYWTESQPAGAGHRDVRGVAEAIDGPSVKAFAPLCRELSIYLTVPIIEAADSKFYNTVLLLDPQGEIIIHHRKVELWSVADADWASEGEPVLKTADTPYGRLCVMICRDMKTLPELLAGRGVNLVLHSAGFYGPNFEAYLESRKYLRHFLENGCHIIVANWSTCEKSWWEGYGLSRIIARDGTVKARALHDLGDEVVIADLPLP